MDKVSVIMPFTASWSDTVWGALQNIEQLDKSIIMDRANIGPAPEEHLAEHVERWLSESAVVIADLSGINPNVHIEIGYLIAIRKPLLLIAQDRKWVTTHLQGRIVEEYDLNNSDSLKRLTHTMLSRVREKLELVREKEKSRAVELDQQEVYQVECYSHRAAVGLQEYFQKAEKQVDILTTNLSFLFEEYDSSTGRTYFDELKTALDRKDSKLRVNILTLDPESDFAAKRGKQLGIAPAVFRDMLRQALADTKRVATSYPSARFEVRTYEDFPNQITFRIDKWIFNCVVAQPTQSRNHLTFKLNVQNKGVENSFINHFRNIWGK